MKQRSDPCRFGLAFETSMEQIPRLDIILGHQLQFSRTSSPQVFWSQDPVPIQTSVWIWLHHLNSCIGGTGISPPGCGQGLGVAAVLQRHAAPLKHGAMTPCVVKTFPLYLPGIHSAMPRPIWFAKRGRVRRLFLTRAHVTRPCFASVHVFDHV